MKITESQLIKILKKSISEALESEYFGKTFVDFKRQVNRGEDPLEVASRIFTKMGEGSTRVAFSSEDMPGFVLKVIKWKEDEGVDPKTGFERQQMIDSNKWEADLQMQQKYPDVFPRTFEHADDFSWILSEKVNPIKSFQELISVMNLGDEKFSNMPFVRNVQFQALIELGIDYFQKLDSPARKMVSEIKRKIIKSILVESYYLKEENEDDILGGDTVPITKDQDVKDATADVTRGSPMIRRLKKILQSRQNNKLLAAMGDLDIPPIEFAPKNLGISEISGKLVLLDASLWKEYKPVN